MPPTFLLAYQQSHISSDGKIFYCLYKSLKNRIDDLDDRIEAHGHLLNEQQIYSRGGSHDILFLLKSYDLDLKKGYKLGTVFGYGYADESANVGN